MPTAFPAIIIIQKKPGSIGPQIYGSSKELLSNKINFGIYPKNYKPKRSTKIMPLQPHSDKEIANLRCIFKCSLMSKNRDADSASR
jgi:hypothetical protein